MPTEEAKDTTTTTTTTKSTKTTDAKKEKTAHRHPGSEAYQEKEDRHVEKNTVPVDKKLPFQVTEIKTTEITTQTLVPSTHHHHHKTTQTQTQTQIKEKRNPQTPADLPQSPIGA